MKRVVFLLFVVVILLAASFMMGFGWYLYIPQKIREIVGEKQINEQHYNVSEIPLTEEAKQVRLKIGERAGYKMAGYSIINVTITNLDNFDGDARIMATLYYARTAVANSTILVKNIKANEKTTKTIVINTTKQWNAFDVRQI